MRVRLAGGGGNLLLSGVTVGLPPNVAIQFARGYDANGAPGFYADVPPSVAASLINNLSAFAVSGDARSIGARLSTTDSYPQVTPAVPANLTPPPPPPPPAPPPKPFILDQSKLGGPDVLA